MHLPVTRTSLGMFRGPSSHRVVSFIINETVNTCTAVGYCLFPMEHLRTLVLRREWMDFP